MATTDKYRLSLVAQYDEIVRNRAVLTAGIEAEFIAFVASQEELRKRYATSENELANLREKVKSLENENMALETKLKHARNQIDVEIGKRKRVEEEREGYEKQILLVQEILTDKNNTTNLNDEAREKLAFLSMTCKSPMYEHSTRSRNMPMIEESCSILSPSDISYDKTEEDLDESINHHHQHQHKGNRRGGKRPSAPPFEEDDDEDVDGGVIIGGGGCGNFQQSSRPTSVVNNVEQAAKKHRRSKSADLVTMEMMNNNHNHHNHITATTSNNGMSGVGAGVGVMMDGGKTPKTPRDRRNSSPFGILNRCNSQDCNIPLAGKSPELKRFNSGNSLTRPHYFQNIHHYKQESCFACNKKLKFGAAGVKCKDCKILCHDACKDLAPLPCMATVNTPKVNKSSPGFLSDYAPSEPPFVPAIVIHCIKEVELRGLKELGIYRVSGSDKEVKELKEKFLRGKTAPNLSSISDIHVICSCLKDFLRNLKEPLVTYQLWGAFLKAAEKHDRQESITDTYQVISMLPISNRDTFAYIILHLLRVMECKECKMDINNLVRVFAPTMIGFSCPNPTPTQMIQETAKQQMVMNRLIDIPSDYWFNFLRVQDGGLSFQFSTPSNDRFSQRLETLTHTNGTTAKGVLTSSSSNANIINTPGNYYEVNNNNKYNNNNNNNYNNNNNNNNGWFTPSNQMRGATTMSNYAKKTTNFFAPPILK